jgi:hypothetical protein
VAFQHQFSSYRDLSLARGVLPPPERQIAETIEDNFFSNTGVLIYDYIPAWVNSKKYGNDEMVFYNGSVFTYSSGDWDWKQTNKSVGGAGPKEPTVVIDPENDPVHWSKQNQCEPDSTKNIPKPMLRVWLLSGNRIEAYGAVHFSPELLENALLQFNKSLGLKMTGNPNGARGFGERDNSMAVVSFDEALTQFSTILIPKDFWPIISKFEQLILVPQLGIAEVPFELLRGPDGSRLVETTSVWIARGIMDVAYSQHVYYMTSLYRSSNKHFAFDSPLVVGNPAFKSSRDLYLPQLPGAEEEAKAVSAIMRTNPLLGADATKKTVESRARTADVLYFATHGAAEPDDPLSGFLALAGAPDESGRWTAKEIQSLDLSRTDLAVLSACQTGLGGVHAAGIIGVGRAFSLAGVRWVVMSLWNVDDRATAGLMQDFVQRLASCKALYDCAPAVLLRKAMLNEEKLNPDPRTWGSFVVFGVPSGSSLQSAEHKR